MATNCWDQFTNDQWDEFTFDLWDAFEMNVCIDTGGGTVIGDGFFKFGTNNVKVSILDNGIYAINAVLESESQFTEQDIFIGGNPIRLAGNGGIFYRMSVINKTPAFVTESTVDQGLTTPISEQDNGRRKMGFLGGSGSTTADDYTVVNGIPLALNENKELILRSSSIDEQEFAETMVGGNPVEIIRENQHWYLPVGII